MTDPLENRAGWPVARYVVEPHSQLDGCYQIARHSVYNLPTQRIGNYTDHDTALEAAEFLNGCVDWETP